MPGGGGGEAWLEDRAGADSVFPDVRTQDVVAEGLDVTGNGGAAISRCGDDEVDELSGDELLGHKREHHQPADGLLRQKGLLGLLISSFLGVVDELQRVLPDALDKVEEAALHAD